MSGRRRSQADTPIEVGILYPADPLGALPGGIETFIRGLIRWSPEDVHFNVIGLTTDERRAPVGVSTDSILGDRHFLHHPLFLLRKPGSRPVIPFSVQHFAAVARHRNSLCRNLDVLDFHRIELLWLFREWPVPRNAFLHQDMRVIRRKDSDIRWRYLPGAYDWIEKKLISIVKKSNHNSGLCQ